MTHPTPMQAILSGPREGFGGIKRYLAFKVLPAPDGLPVSIVAFHPHPSSERKAG